MQVNIIAALGARTLAIGKDNKLLWHIPPDLSRFKRLTFGKTLIMGRKTFESIIDQTGGLLPDRRNLVLTRDTSWQHQGCTVAHSLTDALEEARRLDKKEVFIVGGGDVYTQALPLADRLYLTLVEDDSPGDTFFPRYKRLFTETVFDELTAWGGTVFRLSELKR